MFEHLTENSVVSSALAQPLTQRKEQIIDRLKSIIKQATPKSRVRLRNVSPPERMPIAFSKTPQPKEASSPLQESVETQTFEDVLDLL